MSRLRAAFARLTGMFAGRRADDELREEMESHIEMATADYIARGMSPAEARRKALVEAGGLDQAADAVRDQRGLPWLERTTSDVRYALRALRHSPVFAAVVILTLALGIGANTAIFSVVQAVVLRPLPHHDGDRLVYLQQSMDGPGGENLGFSVPEVRDFRQGAPSFAGIAELSNWELVLQREQEAERIDVGLVTGNYFDVMGLSPILGRLTSSADDGPGVPPVAVLRYESWMKRFGGDSSIVGKRIRLDGVPVTVIGVLEPAPFFPGEAEALLNMVISDHHISATMVEGRTHRMTEVVARLAPNASLAQARNEVAAVSTRIQKQYPDAYDAGANHRIAVVPFSDALNVRARLTLWLLIGAAAFVLIISAASVANLTLMRGVRREHELVVRASLGAGVARLRRMLLTENLVLALLGTVLGVLIAVAGVDLLTSLVARYSPRAHEIRLDAAVLAFALVLALLLSILLSFLGSLPKEGAFGSRILAGTNRVSASHRKQRLQRALVVVQIAVSVVLLAGAGLLTRTMMSLADVDTGLRTEEVLSMTVTLLTPAELLTNPGADGGAKARYATMLDEIGALPGVTAAAIGSPTPLRRSNVVFEVKAEDRPLAVGAPPPRAELRTADPEFFRAAGIPLLDGRAFAATDRFGSPDVVIINRTLAERLFPNEEAVGKRVAWTGDVLRFTPISGDWRTVVGVAADTKDGGLDAEPRPVMWMPFAQMLALGGGLAIRADSNVASLIPAVTRIVKRIAPGVPIENVATISQIKDQSVSPRRLNAVLVSSLGMLAVIIAAVGIAGVLAFSVSARTNEIGIRMSLGADSGRVQRMILGEGGTLLIAGLVLGLAGALLATRVIRGLLFGVTPGDPATFVGVSIAMAAIGLAACWIPALRAARIDPAITMRAQ